MKPEDKDKLNECLKILDTTDLGLSLVWLWTWSTINNIMEEIRVICDSEITILNLKTGYIYKDEAEAQADKTVDPKDIRRDVKIIVPTIPLFSKT